MATYTIFASTNDDYLDSSSTTYSTAVAGSSLLTGSVGNSDPLHISVANTVSGTVFFIDETFLIFDTSSIPTSEVVTGVTLSLNLYQDFSSVDFTVEIRGYTSADPPTTSDWRTPTQLAAATLLATLATSGIGATNAYKAFTENGTNFRSWINRGGSTRFVANADTTRTSSAPTGPTQDEYVIFYSADNTGTTSDPKIVITTTPGAPGNTVLPAITGTAQVGSTLTSGTGTWTGTPTSYAYQWNRAGTPIGGATASTYVPVSADVGSTLTVTVTATNATGSTPATSTATAAVTPSSNVGVTSSPGSISTIAGQTIYWRARAIVSAQPGVGDTSAWGSTANFVISANPAPIALPVITGSPVLGQTLSTSTGTWSGAPTGYTYQWRRDSTTNIGGATTGSYVLVSGDVGHTIDVVVTATNGSGSTAQAAAATAVVTGPAPANITLPTISGLVSAGSVLSVTTGTWTNTPTSYSYQWRWHDTLANIGGATSATYTLVSGDAGHTIDCVVTATNASGSGTATAPATAAVTAAAPANTVAPAVTGFPVRTGIALAASPGTWAGSPSSFAYQWRWHETAAPIVGATATTYTLGDADVGHTIDVAVTATGATGTGSATSAPTVTVTAAPLGVQPATPPGRWQFLVVTTTGTGLEELTVATNRALTFDLYKPASASFDMPGTHPQALIPSEIADDLLCMRDGRRMFLGRLGATADTIDGTAHTVNFAAVDYQGMLARRIIWPGSRTAFAQVDQRDIAWALITDTQALGTLGITTTSTATGVLRDRTYNEGDVIGDQIVALSQVIGGFDWEVDAFKSFNVWYPQRGKPAGQGATLAYGVNVAKVARVIDPSQFANAVRHSGATGLPAATASVTPGAEGRWEKQIGDTSVVLASTLVEKAGWELQLNSTILPSYTVTLTSGWWTPDLVWLGDYVTLVVRSGRLNIAAALRVITVAVTIDDTGHETVAVTLGQSLGSFFDKLAKYPQRFQNLERR